MKNPATPGHFKILAEIAALHSFKTDVAAAAAGVLNR